MASSFPFPPSAWSSPRSHRLSSPSSKPPFPIFPARSSRLLRPTRASPADPNPDGKQPVPDAVKLAFSKAESYKKSKKLDPDPKSERLSRNVGRVDAGSPEELPPAVEPALPGAKAYEQHKVAPEMDSGQEKMNLENLRKSAEEKKTIKKGDLRVSATDFLGLEFAEKRSYRGTPPGLAPVVGPLVDGDSPEVELIVGDPSKFGDANPSKSINQEENQDNAALYKPKVSTWGVFPRPNNISKTFGGGRNIKPGEALETAEAKTAKVKRSRELIAAYKSRVGLTIDAKTKAACEKALKEGDRLMDLGRLREALPFYEKIMKDLVYQSELHGQAALQWSICQDSLSRSSEAKAMYEKLQSHPSAQVSKKARQFAFSFQAIELMKVSSSSFSRTTGYETYFDAFVDAEEYAAAEEKKHEESPAMQDILPYVLFLISPFLLIIFLVARKSYL